MLYTLLANRGLPLLRASASTALCRSTTTMPRFRAFSTSKSTSVDAGTATVATDDVPSSNGESDASPFNQMNRSNSTGPRFFKSRIQVIRKGDKNYRRYDNYAPVLFQWAQELSKGELTLDSLLASEKYAKVSKAICDTTRHSNSNILNLLKSCIIINFDPDTRLVTFLENELLLKLETFDLSMLISTYQLYSPPAVATSSPLRGQIVDMINRNINDRLDVFEPSLSDIILLIRNSRHYSAEILSKIEDHATRFLDANEDISLDQLCYLCVLLSRYNRRNKPLIRAVVAKLLRFRSDEVYSMPPHLIYMISSLNRLNFPEINLLEKCSDILVKLDFLESVNDSPRRDFLVAISQFNFHYPKLMDYYLQKLQEKPELFKFQDLITLTITMARLNFHTDDFRGLLATVILPQCSDPAEFVSKSQYFNFVYSLALLRQAPVEHLKTICSKEFFTALEHEEVENYLSRMRQRNAKQLAALGIAAVEESGEDGTGGEALADGPVPEVQGIYQVMSLRRKYLTLAGLLITEDSGKALEDVFATDAERLDFEKLIGSLEFEPLKRNKDLHAFRENIFRLLDNFAPRGKYMAVDRKLPFGFSIDAELLINSEGQPLPVDSEELSNCKRVALMCIGFNDTLLETSSNLIGPKEVEMRILRSLGYLVIPVHQNLIPAGTTPLNRVKFLQNLIASHQREAVED